MIDESFARMLCVWGANYLLISTCMIGLTWLLSRLNWFKSEQLQDQLWKFAVFSPICLAGLQVSLQSPVAAWNLGELLRREEPGLQQAAVAPPKVTFSKTMVVLESPELTEFEPIPDLFDTGSAFASLPDEATQLNLTEQPPLPTEGLSDSHLNVPSKMTLSVANSPIPEGHSKVPEPWVTKIPTVDSHAVSLEPVENMREGVATDARPTQALQPALGIALIATGLFVLGLLRTAAQACMMWRTVRRCRVLTSGTVVDALTRVKRKFNTQRAITILARTCPVEPAACGVWTWRILVPEQLAMQLSVAELEALLAHEIAHLIRRDPLWVWGLQLMQNCFIWQPLNWLAVRQSRMAAERCCDANAIRSGIDRLTLARCLTRVAAWNLSPQPAFGVGASTSSLGKRIEKLVAGPAMVDSWGRGWRAALRRTTLLILIPLALLVSPRFSWSGSEETSAAIEEKLVLPMPVKAIDSEAEIAEFLPPSMNDTSEDATRISAELEQISTELALALKLLADEEDDPERHALVSAIEQRLEQLKERALIMESHRKAETTHFLGLKRSTPLGEME